MKSSERLRIFSCGSVAQHKNKLLTMFPGLASLKKLAQQVIINQ
jgi:hypothetical protein